MFLDKVNDVYGFVREFIQWARARKYARRVWESYFFGGPDSPKAHDRIIAFRISTGEMSIKEAQERSPCGEWCKFLPSRRQHPDIADVVTHPEGMN